MLSANTRSLGKVAEPSRVYSAFSVVLAEATRFVVHFVIASYGCLPVQRKSEENSEERKERKKGKSSKLRVHDGETTDFRYKCLDMDIRK